MHLEVEDLGRIRYRLRVGALRGSEEIQNLGGSPDATLVCGRISLHFGRIQLQREVLELSPGIENSAMVRCRAMGLRTLFHED